MGLDTAYNLVHIATNTGWVIEHQHQLVLWVDDEHRTDSQREGLLVTRSLVNHAICHRNGSILITNDGELNFDLVFAVRHHIPEPIMMAFYWIHRECCNQAVHRCKLIVLQSQPANLSCAHRCEVCWMGEQDGPLVLLPLME